jgi:RIO-like serine/threonine protein kinase
LIKGEDIVKCAKVQKIKFWEHLKRLEDIKIVKKITNWKTTGVRIKGRQKDRWR